MGLREGSCCQQRWINDRYEGGQLLPMGGRLPFCTASMMSKRECSSSKGRLLSHSSHNTRAKLYTSTFTV